MPTPSEEVRNAERGTRKGEWAAHTDRPKRSVFGNYQKSDAAGVDAASERSECEGKRDSVLDCASPLALSTGPADARAPEDWRSPRPGGGSRSPESRAPSATLQSSIDTAVARTFLYRFLAKAFEDPEPDGWQWLASREISGALRSAMETVAADTLTEPAEILHQLLAPAAYDDFAAAHLACFGHTVRGDCPMNEIEYGDIKADPLFQPHRLSDLGAFFAAFGLELMPDAAERIDHISIELEFMSVLAAKEAHALEHQSDDDALATLRDAQRKFLREHLGRWTPAFARRLARMADGTGLGALARFLGELIKIECARFNVPAGSEDLLLRPVDDATERLCETCGIHGLPPGAATTGPKF